MNRLQELINVKKLLMNKRILLFTPTELQVNHDQALASRPARIDKCKTKS